MEVNGEEKAISRIRFRSEALLRVISHLSRSQGLLQSL